LQANEQDGKTSSLTLNYYPDVTLALFHQDESAFRCIVGPRGSGKTTTALWEMCYFIPKMLKEKYGVNRSKWIVLRNTYVQLIDTTQRSIFEWFDPTYFGRYYKQEKRFVLNYDGMEVELLFRSCDRPDEVRQFKSLELTGYWIDESCEVADAIKLMLKSSIGRFPRKEEWPGGDTLRFGIETTNPMDIDSKDYQNFFGATKLENHKGFWQTPGENLIHLRPGYYDDLRKDYANDPDWVERYIEGKPGVTRVGKDVYGTFSYKYHVSTDPLAWPDKKFTIYRGWDNTGNTPACVACYVPSPGIIHILREFYDDHSGIVDFAEHVNIECKMIWPNAEYIDWGDPAGETQFSSNRAGGGLTSNAKLMRDAGIEVRSSVDHFEPRRESVDYMLRQQYRGEPALLIDPTCNRLLNGFLGGYGYKEKNGIFSERPVKNKYSHVHDALQYVVVKLANYRKPKPKKKKTSRMAAGYGG
jgi:hypothetical protein